MAGAFVAAVAWSAVRPYHWDDYLLEIAVPVAGFVLLLVLWRRFRFSRLACALMFLEALVLVVGAHYTHARVPAFDWIKDALGMERNHYDRFAHFAVGLFLVIPVREVLIRCTPLRGGWLTGMSVVSILALAALYEVLEWWIAVLASAETGANFLGAQGDPWDAQKDMLLDGLGAATSLLLFTRCHDRELLSLAAAAGESTTRRDPRRPGAPS
jgi:putative membrane protein